MDGRGRVRIDYRVSARGLIGFQGEFMNATRGSGLQSHVFDGYAPLAGDIAERRNGVLISSEHGDAVAYSIFELQERGRLFVWHDETVYEGMIIGIHSRENDLVVNPIKTKKLTNVRASGKDDALILTPPIELTLEYAVEFIADDELVEVTPKTIRIRKRKLPEHERKRAIARGRGAAGLISPPPGGTLSDVHMRRIGDRHRCDTIRENAPVAARAGCHRPRVAAPTLASIDTGEVTMKKMSSKWHAVSIVLQGTSCAAATLCRNKRFLSAQIPALPLRDCDQRPAAPASTSTTKTAAAGVRRTDDVHRDLRSEFLERNRRSARGRRTVDSR